MTDEIDLRPYGDAMTPAQHYARADELVQMVEDGMDGGTATLEGIDMLTRLAAVHAQLALYVPPPSLWQQMRGQ